LTYDQAVFINTPKKMSKVKLKLKQKTDAGLKTFAEDHITKMTGNANYPTPDPSAADFLILKNDYGTALAESIAAQALAKEKTALKDAKRLALETGLTLRGKYVDLKSAGDKVKILSAGFDVAEDRAPTPLPEPVSNLSLTAGDSAGEIDAQWDSEPVARTYHVETSPDPMTATSWTRQKDVTKSKAVILGLASGARVWMRVRAVNAAGEGPWSDPATKIVP
jgi:hypothetical protein